MFISFGTCLLIQFGLYPYVTSDTGYPPGMNQPFCSMTDATLKSKPHRVEAFRIAGRSAEDRGQHRAVEEGKQVSLCQGWWNCFQWVSSKSLRCSVVGAAAVAVAVVSQQGLSILDTGPCISRLEIIRYYMIRIDQMMHCFPTTTRQP